MKNFLAIVCLAMLTACASVGTNDGQLAIAYNTTNAYVEVTKQSLARGRITVKEAQAASAKARKLRSDIDKAALVLSTCKPPCTSYTDLMKAIQPALLELEIELRQREKDNGQ